MKIMIDSRFWGPKHTGLGRYTESLVRQLHQLKPKHEIILLIDRRDRRLIHRVVPRFQLVSCSSRPYGLKEQWQIPWLLKRVKPDLVHFLHFNVPVFYSGRFMVTIHDLIKHHSTGLATTTRSPLGYCLARLGYRLTIQHALKQAEVILTPSAWVKKDISYFYPFARAKIKVTPEAPAPVYLSKTISSQTKLKPPKSYLIYVGNAYPHKNIVQLIKAIQIINQENKLKLVIITGRGVFYQRLRRQIRKLKAQAVVRLRGFTSDKELKLLFQQAQAFITPSLLEGFGLPGLEAMASGTLVLASNRTALPEVYQNHALYFDPENLKDIVRKIRQGINLSPAKRQELIKSGQAYARCFSWLKTAKKTLAVYDSLA
jgi:glycosyltransferase involved in cell wall biosynthesis